MPYYKKLAMCLNCIHCKKDIDDTGESSTNWFCEHKNDYTTMLSTCDKWNENKNLKIINEVVEYGKR